MFNPFTKKTYIWWLVSGLLIGLAFIHPYTWWFFLPSLLLLIHSYTKALTAREVFLGIWLFGTLKSAGAIFWFWYVYPLNWIVGLSLSAQVGLVGIMWLSSSMALGLGFALVFFLTKKYLNSDYWLITLPAVYVLADLGGSLIFSLYTLGPGSGLNFQFSFGYLGYLLADVDWFLNVAKWFGVYGLSLLAVVSVLIVYVFFFKIGKKESRWFFLIVFLLVIFISNVISPSTSEDKVEYKVIAVDTSFDATMQKNFRGLEKKDTEILKAVTNALSYHPDIVALPEDSRFTLGFSSTEAALAYISTKNNNFVLYDSARIIDERGETILRAFIYDTNKQTVSVIDKQYLVPQGEFVTYLNSFFINIFAKPEFFEKISAEQSYRPGLIKNYDFVPKDNPPVLFCMESVAPTATYKLLKEQPSSLVLHLVSHAWFNQPKILWMNLARMLKIQAVWNQVTIIEAANMKESEAYSPLHKSPKVEILDENDYWKLKLYQFD